MIGSGMSAGAFPIFGRGEHSGYFTGGYVRAGATNVLPSYGAPCNLRTDQYVRAGDAIPRFIDSVDEFMNYLRSEYNGCAHRRTGVAFIVHTMLGRSGGSVGRDVSGADFADLDRRLRSPHLIIHWNTIVTHSINSYYSNNHNDTAFYRHNKSESGILIVDRRNGGVLYEILHACANPMGASVGLPYVPQWHAGGSGFIQKDDGAGNFGGNLGTGVNNARPGERYRFNHRIFNQGPEALDRNIDTWYDYAYPGSVVSRVDQRTLGFGVGSGQTIRDIWHETPVIPANAGGERYCSRAYFSPAAYNNPSIGGGPELCVNVPFSYALTPRVSTGGDSGTSVEQGSRGTNVDFQVDNDGPTQSRPSRWQLIRFDVRPGSPGSSATQRSPNNNSDGCTTHNARPGVTNCDVVRDGTNRVFEVGNTDLGQLVHDTGDVPVGTRICFVLSVSWPTQVNNPSWGHSQPACIVVVKKPKLQVHGGDLWVGRQFIDDTNPRAPADIITSTSNAGGRLYGSWAEYGILATGSVTGMSSGAGLAGGAPQNRLTAELHKLTFANKPTFGGFTSAPVRIPDYISIYNPAGGTAVGPTLNLTSAADGRYISENNVTVSTSGNIPLRKDIVIRARTVTINSDISFQDSYRILGDIPRIIIIADGDVRITPNVKRIDAWIITKGQLFTCTDPKDLTTEVCKEKLDFNGPVVAKDTSLRRTFGAEAGHGGRDTAAETFNLRPDALLRAYESARQDERAQTVYQIELPPRY